MSLILNSFRAPMQGISSNRFTTEEMDESREFSLFPNYQEEVSFEVDYNPIHCSTREELLLAEQSNLEKFTYDVVSYLHDNFKQHALNLTRVGASPTQIFSDKSDHIKIENENVEKNSCGTQYILATVQNGRLMPVDLCPEKISGRDDFWYYPVRD